MTTKLVAMTSLVAFWFFMPFFMMLFNLSGFTEVDTEAIERITADDFNIFTLSGFEVFVNFVFELGKFSVSQAPLFFIVLFSVFGVITILVGLLFLRGGGS